MTLNSQDTEITAQALAKLVSEGLVEKVGDVYRITPLGTSALNALTAPPTDESE